MTAKMTYRPPGHGFPGMWVRVLQPGEDPDELTDGWRLLYGGIVIRWDDEESRSYPLENRRD